MIWVDAAQMPFAARVRNQMDGGRRGAVFEFAHQPVRPDGNLLDIQRGRVTIYVPMVWVGEAIAITLVIHVRANPRFHHPFRRSCHLSILLASTCEARARRAITAGWKD